MAADTALARQLEDPLAYEAALLTYPGLQNARSLARARREQRQDWVTYTLFFTFAAAVDAYVTAHLKDFPGEVQTLPAADGGLSLRVSVPVGETLMPDQRPIGVFDSGIGGLTVVRELLHRLPNERSSTSATPRACRTAQVAGDGRALLRGGRGMAAVARREDGRHRVQHGHRARRRTAGRAAADPRHRRDRAGRARRGAGHDAPARVGVIGTAGTIASGAYDLAVRRRLPDARVYAQPCPLFVPLVEEGWRTHGGARLIAEDYLAPLCARWMSTCSSSAARTTRCCAS
jgi:hypothetical protein